MASRNLIKAMKLHIGKSFRIKYFHIYFPFLWDPSRANLKSSFRFHFASLLVSDGIQLTIVIKRVHEHK